MGGMPVKPVVCSDYKDGAVIEKDVDMYIVGMQMVMESWKVWAWFSLWMPWQFS